MWLFALVCILIALYHPNAWSGPMEEVTFPWVALWFEDGKPMIGAPEIGFRTHDACVLYATDRVTMAEEMGITVTFQCRLGPYREA